MRIIVDSNIPFASSAFAGIGEIAPLETRLITHAAVRDADVLVVRSETKVNRALLEGTRIKFVGTATIGFDHIDVDYVWRNGIGFASAPGSNANSVAEYIVAALLTLAQRKSFTLKGKTLGVVGVGNIGSKVVRMAEALGMRVLQNDPPLARMSGDSRFRSLDDLMDADIITLHVPLTKTGPDATFHLFDSRRIEQMKKGAILINTSRGSVIETSGISSALQRGYVSAAVLDVWEGEPAIDMDLLDRVTIGTPHIAGYSLDGKVKAMTTIYKAVCNHFSITPMLNGTINLPSPDIGMIQVSDLLSEREDIVRSAVRQCYDIASDDTQLRGIISMPEHQRASYFMRLRAEYRVRREFFAAPVDLPQRHVSVAPVLSALGFVLKGNST